MVVLRIAGIKVLIEFVVSVDHTSLYEFIVWVYIASSVYPTADVQLLYFVLHAISDRGGGTVKGPCERLNGRKV